jgi:hypothetical protein
MTVFCNQESRVIVQKVEKALVKQGGVVVHKEAKVVEAVRHFRNLIIKHITIRTYLMLILMHHHQVQCCFLI